MNSSFALPISRHRRRRRREPACGQHSSQASTSRPLWLPFEQRAPRAINYIRAADCLISARSLSRRHAGPLKNGPTLRCCTTLPAASFLFSTRLAFIDGSTEYWMLSEYLHTD